MKETISITIEQGEATIKMPTGKEVTVPLPRDMEVEAFINEIKSMVQAQFGLDSDKVVVTRRRSKSEQCAADIIAAEDKGELEL